MTDKSDQTLPEYRACTTATISSTSTSSNDQNQDDKLQLMGRTKHRSQPPCRLCTFAWELRSSPLSTWCGHGKQRKMLQKMFFLCVRCESFQLSKLARPLKHITFRSALAPGTRKNKMRETLSRINFEHYVKVHIKLSSLINLWAWYFGFFDWALFQMTVGIKVTVITV